MIKIAFLGTPDFVQPIKDALAKHFTLVDSLNEADLAVVAAYGKILTPKELSAPKYGAINVHPSLLPKYRGPSPIQSAILNGDKVSGITIIKMDEEIDHGPIIYQEEIELSDRDNFDILSKKMFLRASEVLPKVIEDFIQGKVEPRLQEHAIATHCNRLTREGGYFDINNPPSPEILDSMIRAYYPWPGVWTKWSPSRHPEGAKRPKDLKIIKFLPFRHPERSEGSLDLFQNKQSLRPNGLKSGDSSLVAQNDRFLLQMEGKKAIPLKDFLNGYPDFPLKSITLDKK